jgi:putative metallohydrolase (TIGR04338 family)
VYAAQDAWLVQKHGRRFTNLPEIQLYVDSLMASNWWARTFPQIDRIDVHPGRKNGVWAYGAATGNRRGEIWLPPRGRAYTELVVLHEIAHCVSSRRITHGPAWVHNFLQLVWRACGDERYQLLVDNLASHGVRF